MFAGVQRLVNRSQCLRRFWEQYLCFIIRGKQMEFTFEVVKPRVGKPHTSSASVACGKWEATKISGREKKFEVSITGGET